MSEPIVLPSLRALQEGILETFAARYAGRVQTVSAYDPFAVSVDGVDPPGQERRPLVTPALLLELSEIGPGIDDGTDRQELLLTLTAHCILSFLTDALQTELREFAADVLLAVRHARWGYPGAVRVPEALSAQPGEFRPGLSGYDSWIVTWDQTVYIGPDAWSGGTAPSEVWLGMAPLVGDMDGGPEDYWLIAKAPEVTT